MDRYHLLFQKFQKNVTNPNLVFSIGNIKSRVASVGYIILHCYDLHDDEILIENNPVHIGKRFVITGKYHEHIEEIDIDIDVLHNTFSFQFEMVLIGISSENPCYFNRIMFEEAPHTEYHKPEEAFDKADILFENNNYAELFNTTNHSLQIIRPVEVRAFNTKYLTANKISVLAPHLDNEPKIDSASNLMMEFINQTEQKIDIRK